MTDNSEDKQAFNARVNASMREFLRRKSWPEKVESIARMNAACRIARESMRKALMKESAPPAKREADEPETGARA